MKLVFYGLWEDERSKLEELHKKYGFDYEATAEELSLLNVSLSEGCAGVSVLGKGAVGDDLLSALHGYGVKFLATRSIGYNHIDLAAAKKYGFKLCNSQCIRPIRWPSLL